MDKSEITILNELSEPIVHALAPEEVESYAILSEEYFENPNEFAKGRGRDQELGVGIELGSLLTPIIIAIAKEVWDFVWKIVKEQAAVEGKSLLQDKVKQFFKPLHKEGKAKESLSTKDLKSIQQKALQTCIKMGVKPADAEQIAGSIVLQLLNEA